jgi:hypothetical protein
MRVCRHIMDELNDRVQYRPLSRAHVLCTSSKHLVCFETIANVCPQRTLSMLSSSTLRWSSGTPAQQNKHNAVSHFHIYKKTRLKQGDMR